MTVDVNAIRKRVQMLQAEFWRCYGVFQLHQRSYDQCAVLRYCTKVGMSLRMALFVSAALAASAIPILAQTVPATPVQVIKTQQPPANMPSPAKSLAFDAVSIKPGHVPTGRQGTDGGGIVQIEPGRGVVFSRNGTVRRMVLEAYHLMPMQLSGEPAWLDADWFVLDAKAERPASADQLRQMLQRLLAERCKLATHRETKEMLVYAVTVAKNGPKLHEIQEDDPEPTRMLSRERAIALWGSRNAEARAHWGGLGSLQQFLQTLPNVISIEGSGVHPIDRPVLDRTGLHGRYWIQIGWDSDDDFIPAIQDELGLRFESQKAPVDVLLIDHIEKPYSSSGPSAATARRRITPGRTSHHCP